MGPLGMLMVQLEDAGLHRDDTFRALVNASPATGAPAEGLRRIAAAVRDAGVDPARLTSLDQVRAGVARRAPGCLDEHLQEYGWRLTTGYDIEDRCLAELPDVLLASIRGAASGEAPADDAHLAPIATLRDEVPAEHRAAFDDAVAGRRGQSYGLRDENGPLTYEWPAGLLRRGLLEAGRRLAERGAIGTADEVFELRIPEVAALLTGAGRTVARGDRRAGRHPSLGGRPRRAGPPRTARRLRRRPTPSPRAWPG